MTRFIHCRRWKGTSYRRAVAGLDYAFPNTLNLTAELYYNGAGASDKQAYDFASLFAGCIQNVGRRYVGLFAGYEITPSLKWNNYFVGNLADRSSYFSPSLTYSIKTDLDWTIGIQLFRGHNGSEYGRLNDRPRGPDHGAGPGLLAGGTPLVPSGQVFENSTSNRGTNVTAGSSAWRKKPLCAKRSNLVAARRQFLALRAGIFLKE